jgi:hypothetical protein
VVLLLAFREGNPMAFSSTVTLVLGDDLASLTDLRAQLLDSEGQAASSVITSGFVNLGNGNYAWTYNSFPDTFSGFVRFWSAANPSDTWLSELISNNDSGGGEDCDFCHVSVDHDYGGTNNLTYQTEDGAGVYRATIYIYLRSDYDAGRRDTDFVIDSATTDVDGHWERPVLLDPGEYVLLFFKRGRFGPSLKYITVS